MKKYLFLEFILLLFLSQTVFGQNIEEELVNQIYSCFASEDIECMVKSYQELADYQKAEKKGDYIHTLQTAVTMLIGIEKYSEASSFAEEIFDSPDLSDDQKSEYIRIIIFQFNDAEAKEQADLFRLRLSSLSSEQNVSFADLNSTIIIQKRVEDCFFIQDYKCGNEGVKRLLEIFSKEKTSLEELGQVVSLMQLQFNNQLDWNQLDWNQVIHNLETVRSLLSQNGYSGSDWYHEVQIFLMAAYDESGDETKYENLVEDFFELSEHRNQMNENIDEIQIGIQGEGGENFEIFNTQLGRVKKTVNPINKDSLQFFFDGRNPIFFSKITEIGKSALPAIIEEHGKLSEEYVDALGILGMSYGQLGHFSKQKEIVNELRVLLEKVPNPEDPLYQNIMTHLVTQRTFNGEISISEGEMINFANNSFSDEIDDDEKEVLVLMMLNSKGILNLNTSFKPFTTPNFLDTFLLDTNQDERDFQELADQLRFRSEDLKANILVLSRANDNETDRYKLQQEHEALLSFALNIYNDHPEIIEYIFNYNLALEQLKLTKLEHLRERLLLRNHPKYIELFESWKEQRERVNDLYGFTYTDSTFNVASAMREDGKLAEIEKQINSVVDQEYNERQAVKWNDLQTCLKPNEALVNIQRFAIRENGEWTKRTGYVAFILKYGMDRPQFCYISDGASLDNKFSEYKLSRSSRDNGSLYNTYWLPISKQLSGISKIYLVSDGIYNNINLSSLSIPDTPDQYLIDQVDIQLMASPLSLLNINPEKIEFKNAILVGASLPEVSNSNGGNRSSGRSRFDDDGLESVEQEISQIKELLQNNTLNVTTYLGQNATEEVVKQISSPDILHVASHVFFKPIEELFKIDFNSITRNEKYSYPIISSMIILKSNNKPTFDSLRNKFDHTGIKDMFRFLYMNKLKGSGINLYNANHSLSNIEGDGRLTSFEILGMNLIDTKLVVLSGCESGLKDLINNSGQGGLSGAFQVAGADYIINSLWNVRDSFGAEFMSTFYGILLNENQNTSEAFRNTQLFYKEKDEEKMYLWGAFVLMKL